MNSRGFFSVFVGAFAIIFLIATFYAQSIHYESQTRAAELGVLQQELSKDWFLARNALSNFAADGIIFSIERQYNAQHAPGILSAANCIPQDILGYDYAVDVDVYWDTALTHMNNNFGTHCDANLSGDVQDLLEGTSFGQPRVMNGERAYGLLSCTRSSPTATLTVKKPFVIRKNVTVSPGTTCLISVFDILGSNDDPLLGPAYSKLDVSHGYP